jgi:hypothetical protein
MVKFVMLSVQKFLVPYALFQINANSKKIVIGIIVHAIQLLVLLVTCIIHRSLVIEVVHAIMQVIDVYL